MPPVLGKFKSCWASGPDGPLYHARPFYGIRWEYLPIPKKTMLQVQVPFLKDMIWINIDPADVFTPSVIPAREQHAD
jgi:hypothetical protein